MNPVVYDAGVLIAADRGERGTWAKHRARLEAGLVPLVPAPVIAQASRSSRQVGLRRLLRGCEVVAMDEAGAHRAGELLGLSRTKDVVDAFVAVVAERFGADVRSDDTGDIERMLAAAGANLTVIRGSR
jgi:hypothetical protein